MLQAEGHDIWSLLSESGPEDVQLPGQSGPKPHIKKWISQAVIFPFYLLTVHFVGNIPTVQTRTDQV